MRAEGANVLADAWLVSRATTELIDAALAPTGLTVSEFGLYSVLTAVDTMTPSDLVRWMSAPPTTVSSYLKRLEERGHLRRERHPTDGRSYVLRLTPAGHKAHEAAGRAYQPILEAVVESLGSREASVRKSLAALRDSINAVWASDPGESF